MAKPAQNQKAFKAGSMVTMCACEHPYQDEKYGKGNRLHNLCKDGSRCTVCNKEKPRK